MTSEEVTNFIRSPEFDKGRSVFCAMERACDDQYNLVDLDNLMAALKYAGSQAWLGKRGRWVLRGIVRELNRRDKK